MREPRTCLAEVCTWQAIDNDDDVGASAMAKRALITHFRPTLQRSGRISGAECGRLVVRLCVHGGAFLFSPFPFALYSAVHSWPLADCCLERPRISVIYQNGSAVSSGSSALISAKVGKGGERGLAYLPQNFDSINAFQPAPGRLAGWAGGEEGGGLCSGAS